jgi:hypothetical protein
VGWKRLWREVWELWDHRCAKVNLAASDAVKNISVADSLKKKRTKVEE